MDAVLTAPERSDLRRLESIIEKGKQTFVEVGQALKQIRDEKLYREKWNTFDAYCEDRFDFKRRYADRLIEAAEIKMSPIGLKISNEAQAREVAKTPPKKRSEVVKTAEKIAKEAGKPVSAKVIAEARDTVVEGEVVSKKPPKPGSEVHSHAKIIDKFYKAHFPPLCRGIDAAADAIGPVGNRGPNYKMANDALNAFSKAVEQMREGKP